MDKRLCVNVLRETVLLLHTVVNLFDNCSMIQIQRRSVFLLQKVLINARNGFPVRCYSLCDKVAWKTGTDKKYNFCLDTDF